MINYSETSQPSVVRLNPMAGSSSDKISPIGEQISGLESATTILEDRLSMLQNKLSPILSQTVEKGIENNKTPEEILSPVPSAIRDNKKRVFSAISRIEYIIDKLEL